jgi:hypothetical protein
MSVLICIWIVLMVLTGIGKAAENRKKRQAILDRQYQEALRNGREAR